MTRLEIGLPPPPWIVGHRGAAGEAPENTLDGLRLAVEQGADMVELDLQLTGDGELVACHDWDLGRMGDRPSVVEETPLGELTEIEISGPFRRRGSRRTLATLKQLLDTLPEEVPLNLELNRRVADPERLAERLAADIADRPHLLLSSFDWPLLEIVRRALPRSPLAPIGGRRADPAALIDTAVRLDAWSVHCRHTLASRGLVEAAGERPVLAYTLNEPGAARRLFERGVRGVFTDFPGRLRAELESSLEARS
jgi:glycerophosphoryl diester phosphodiesterase